MQSNNGDLYFRAGIDLDGFNAGADAMERRTDTLTSHVVSSAGQMDDAISKIGGAFTRIAGAAGAGAFIKEMFNVRSEMQNTEAMLRVFLGSAEKAASFFKQLQGYAYNNVFEFKDLAAQSAQLLAYGNAVESVIPTLNKLSEIAAGTNVPLEELVSIWNKVKVTDKMDSNTIYSLGAKGIDVRQAIADIKELETGQKMLAKEVDVTGLKFQDLQKIIDHVATDGGMFDGMMQEKMKTLGDSWGLMQDNLTNMFNEIGEQNQGLLKAGMDVGNYLIENYQSVAKVLGTLMVAYGAAKAANIALNIAQKNGTGVTVLDNTVWAIRGKLMQAEMQNGKDVTSIIRQKVAAQKEEIATLKAQITEEEHAELLQRNRIDNLDQVLTSTQKARLAQMGLTDAGSDYLAVASSMLSKEQQLSMSQMDLTNNNQAYINALKEKIALNKEELQNIDEIVEAARQNLATAENELDTRIHLRDALKERLAGLEEEKERLYETGNASEYAEACAEAETVADQLNTAEKNLNSAAEAYNAAQTDLATAAEKRNTLATNTNTTADKVNTVQKNILSVAVNKLRISFQRLWLVMKANPIGAIITVATSLYAIISRFISKNKEAREEQEAHNRAMAEFTSETDKAKSRVDSLAAALQTAKQGTKEYNDALKEVNSLCKEYNISNLNINSTLDEQRRKYDELKVAIDNATAARLRDKYTDDAFSKKQDREVEIDTDLTEEAGRHHTYIAGTNLFGKDRLHRVTSYYNDALHILEKNNQLGLLQARMKSLATDVAMEVSTTEDALQNIYDLVKEFGAYYTYGDDSKKVIADYFGKYVESARETKKEVEGVNSSMETFMKTLNAGTNTTITSKNAMEEYRAAVAEVKKLEDERAKNNKTWTTDEAEANQKALETAKKKRDNLYKQLYGDKSTQKASDERKKYLASLTKEEAMLIFDAEDARIAALQDGAEKEMATLQNNFNRQMTELDFERREIDKKRKEMKLPAINWEETDPEKKTTEQLIDEQKRRALEEAFDRNSKKVFDNEIEQRKKDYETYAKWVENVGQDAADRHYDRLIEKGKSFAEFVENEIARLEDKAGTVGEDGNPIGLTDAELAYLENLKAEKQRNQAKSYASMEEDMAKEIAAATTLAEKLEIINKWLEKIKGNGENSTARDNFLYKMSQQRTELIDEQNTQFNQTYEKYAKKRLMIERDYNRQISELNRQHRTLEAEEVKRSLENTLQELDTDFLKGLVSTVFKNPTKSNMREAMKTLQAIQKMSLKEFNAQFGTEDFQFTQEQLDDIKNSISDVGTEIKKLGQGYTLADAFREIRDGRIEGDMEKVARGTEYMQSAFSKFASVVSTLSQALNDLADASNNENLKKTAKTVNSVANVLTSTGSMAAAGAQVGGGWGALVGAVLGLGTGIFSEVFKGSAEREERIAAAGEKGLEFQQNVADHLTSILGAVESLTDTVTSLNYEQYRSTLLSLIEELKASQKQWTEKNSDGKSYWSQVYDAIRGSSLSDVNGIRQEFGSTDVHNIGNTSGIWQALVREGLISEEEAMERERQILQGSQEEDWNSSVNNFLFGWIDDLLGNERTHTYHIDEDDYKELTAKSVANYINWMAGQFAEEQGRLIGELRDLYSSNSYDSLEYYNKENEVYQSQLDYLKFQRAWLAALGQDTTEIDRQIAEMEHNMSESLQHMAEGLYGMDMGSIINEWISIFEEFGDNVDGAFNKIDQGIDKMIANMLRQRLVIEPLMEQLTQIFEDYKAEVGADHKYTNEDFIKIANRIREAKGDAYEGYQEYLRFLENLGINLDDITDTSTATGSLQNLSEETGGVIAGRMNAAIIGISDGNNILRQSLLVQIETKNYTAQMADDLRYIKQRMNGGTVRFNENMNYGYSEVSM